MEIFSHPAISDIINTQNNNVCFDCGFPKPKWASINNGIFLCLKCAGVHRNFGVRFSIIRSIQLESWDDKQIQFLKLGGNLNFKHFLNEYNINSNSNDNNLKYKSKCAEYYRKYLRSLVEKEINPNYIEENIPKPSLQEGLEIIDNSNNDLINNDKIIQSGQYKEEKEETFFGFVGNFFKKASKKVVDAGKDVGKKIENLNIPEKVAQTGNNAFDIVKKGGSLFINTTSDIAKKGGNLIVGAATEFKEKGGNLIQKIGVKAEAGFNVIKDTTKSIIVGKNEETKGKKNENQNDINMNSNKNNDVNNIINENNNQEKNKDVNNNILEKKEEENKDENNKIQEKKENENKNNEEKKEEENNHNENNKLNENNKDDKKEEQNNNQDKNEEENNNIKEKNEDENNNKQEKKDDENNNKQEKKEEEN